jgi:hypothetical protein
MTDPVDQEIEAEDFSKEISFESGQFAIIDGDLAKALKDKVPMAEKAIFIPTKTSRGTKVTFSVKAVYDDASLKRLVIEPGMSETEVINGPESMEEAALPGINHEGGRVEKIVSKIQRKAAGPVPKTADRSKRNKRYSKGGDPSTVLTTGGDSVERRVQNKMALDGGRRNNYGQLKSKKKTHSSVEVECFEFLDHVKQKTLDESFVRNMKHRGVIHKTLSDMRTGDQVNGKDYDLIFEAVEILNKQHSNDG